MIDKIDITYRTRNAKLFPDFQAKFFLKISGTDLISCLQVQAQRQKMTAILDTV